VLPPRAEAPDVGLVSLVYFYEFYEARPRHGDRVGAAADRQAERLRPLVSAQFLKKLMDTITVG
jgi:hypothetical protein